MKEKKQWTPKEVTAIKCSIELWTWIAETGKDKDEWPEWEENGGQYPEQYYSCFLCEISEYSGGWVEESCSGKCPYGRTYGTCYTDEQPFQQWRDYFYNNKDKSKAGAQAFLQQLKDLLPPEKGWKFKVGDTVRIVKSAYGSLRVGDVGEVIMVHSKFLCTVRFPNKLLTSYNCYTHELEPAPAPPAPPAPPKPIKRVYIAGALSTLRPEMPDTRNPSKVVTDYLSNVSVMCGGARAVIEMGLGVGVFVPALDLLLGVWDKGMTEEDYRNNSTAFLEVCDAMYVISHSKGVDDEITKAEGLGIPVFESLYDLKQAILQGGKQ